jgi:hypothetical protein
LLETFKSRARMRLEVAQLRKRANRATANAAQNVFLKASLCVPHVSFDFTDLPLFKPLRSHLTEGILCFAGHYGLVCSGSAASLDSCVTATFSALRSTIGSVPLSNLDRASVCAARIGQADFGIAPQRHQTKLAFETVLPPPELGAVRLYGKE